MRTTIVVQDSRAELRQDGHRGLCQDYTIGLVAALSSEFARNMERSSCVSSRRCSFMLANTSILMYVHEYVGVGCLCVCVCTCQFEMDLKRVHVICVYLPGGIFCGLLLTYIITQM